MNYRFAGIALTVVAVGALVGGFWGRLPTTSADTTLTSEKIVGDYSEALAAIDNAYSGKIDHETITDTSVQSMLWSLDPHSQFFTREEFRKLNEEQTSQFYGIGVSILQHRTGVYVQSVLPDTPAEKAGVRYGDRFIEIDGKDAREWTSAEVSKNVRGERGTTVKVKIERASSSVPVSFDIVRGGVPLPSIRNYFMLPDNVGYVGLTGGFQETTSEELKIALDQLQSQGMKSLVLDLRGNPGGLLPQAVDVVGKFVPSGKPVVSVKGRSRYTTERKLNTRGGYKGDFPLVVLINGGSASASEIVAGAIQDYGRGLIVGTESFGKGLVQQVFAMPFYTGLTLTTARYYTPLGRSLQRDYSSGSIYEYYTHSDGPQAESNNNQAESNNNEVPKPKPAGVPITAPDGRTLYGGRGIEPDVKADPFVFNAVRFRIADAAFFFVRQVASAKIAGFESMKVDRQNHQITFPTGAFPVNERLFEAFKEFVLADKSSNLTAETLAAHADFAKMRIRQELASASYSNEAAAQVMLELDPQVLKGIEVMPQASSLAQANRIAE